MLLAFFSDWGNGEKLMLLWYMVPLALLLLTLYVFNIRRDFNDCVWLVFIGLLALYFTAAATFDAESNRRETAQLRSELSTKLDVDQVVYVSTSSPFTVVRLGDCKVTLDVRHPAEHQWTAAIKGDAEAQVPIGPKLQTRLGAYCAAHALQIKPAD